MVNQMQFGIRSSLPEMLVSVIYMDKDNKLTGEFPRTFHCYCQIQLTECTLVKKCYCRTIAMEDVLYQNHCRY